MKLTALIPAYNPSDGLVAIIRGLVGSDFAAIIVVDDGSTPECEAIFREVARLEKVTVLRHAVNLGKGAALKTGLNWAYCSFPDHRGVVTLDADGQHMLEDVLNIAQVLRTNPENLVVGAREFDKDVPARSRIGNSLTRMLFRLLIGQKLSDTQSGLRGIPRDFIPRLLKIDSHGYEYELDMLLVCRYTGRRIVEEKIRTVYIDGNKSSHFNPIIDSMKIYFVLFRFTLASLVSALIDNAVFILVYGLTPSVLASQASARILATAFNYIAVRKIVFNSDAAASRTLPGYLTLVLVSGTVSFLLIKVLITFTPLSVFMAKITAESIVFLANFAIQRDFIFTSDRTRSLQDA